MLRGKYQSARQSSAVLASVQRDLPGVLALELGQLRHAEPAKGCGRHARNCGRSYGLVSEPEGVIHTLQRRADGCHGVILGEQGELRSRKAICGPQRESMRGQPSFASSFEVRPLAYPLAPVRMRTNSPSLSLLTWRAGGASVSQPRRAERKTQFTIEVHPSRLGKKVWNQLLPVHIPQVGEAGVLNVPIALDEDRIRSVEQKPT